MIVSGKTDEEHLENLEIVLKRLQDAGLKANQEKCEFFKDRVQFCGHEIDREWQWTEQCEQAVTEAKRMITSEQVLTHYDPALLVRLACDASPTGTSAVLSYVVPDGSERPVAFASRSLTKTERKYAQIDKFQAFVESNGICHITSAP